MTVGTLSTGNEDEDVVFEVSREYGTKTYGTMTWTATANYTSHKVHGNTGAPEWTSNDNDTLSFEAIFSAWLGVNPSKEILKMRNLLATRKLCNLIIGTVPLGYWYVQSCPVEMEHIDPSGNILHAKMKIKLVAEPYPNLEG